MPSRSNLQKSPFIETRFLYVYPFKKFDEKIFRVSFDRWQINQSDTTLLFCVYEDRAMHSDMCQVFLTFPKNKLDRTTQSCSCHIKLMLNISQTDNIF